MRNSLDRSKFDAVIAEARRLSRRDILQRSFVLGLSSLLMVFSLASVAPLIAVGDPGHWFPAVVQGAQWIALQIGLDLIAAAGWVMPLLGAAVLGIYASDYGSRRLFSRWADRDTDSDDRERANTVITTVSVVTGWILTVYIVIAAVTAVATSSHFGSVVLIAVFGALLLATAAWAGSLIPRTPAGLHRSATLLGEAVKSRAKRFPTENVRPLSRAKAWRLLLLWLFLPFLAAGLLRLVALLSPDDVAKVAGVLAVALVLVGVANALVAFPSGLSREASLGTCFDKLFAAFMTLAFALAALSSLLVLAVVLSRAWPDGVALAVSGVVAVAIVLAWCAPRSVLARSRYVWVRTPAFAIDALLRRGIERRRAKVKAQLKHARDYAEAMKRT